MTSPWTVWWYRSSVNETVSSSTFLSVRRARRCPDGNLRLTIVLYIIYLDSFFPGHNHNDAFLPTSWHGYESIEPHWPRTLHSCLYFLRFHHSRCYDRSLLLCRYAQGLQRAAYLLLRWRRYQPCLTPSSHILYYYLCSTILQRLLLSHRASASAHTHIYQLWTRQFKVLLPSCVIEMSFSLSLSLSCSLYIYINYFRLLTEKRRLL